MKADQFARFQNFDGENSQNLFEISWTLTQNTEMAVQCFVGDSTNSILNLAAIANQNLASSIDECIENESIRKGNIPNQISVDAADTVATNVCLRISELNLNE